MTLLLAETIILYKYTDGVLCTFVLLELPLHEAELSLGPLQVLLQSGDLRSTTGSGQQ